MSDIINDLKRTSVVIVLQLLVCCSAFGQRNYSPPINPEDTLKVVSDERFDNNINGWPIGTSEDSRYNFQKGENGSYYSLYNAIDNRSIVALNKGIELNVNTDFVIKVKFDILKSYADSSGNCGGGFVWGANDPYKNMQLLYFNYKKPAYIFAQWNEKGTYKKLFEKELPVNNREIELEIRRIKNTINFYVQSKDSLLLLFTIPTKDAARFYKMGFYLDGRIYMTARRLLVKESFTHQEKIIAFQNRAEDFMKWEEIFQSKTKELSKLTQKKKIDYKDKTQINRIKNSLSTAFVQMANIKWIDNDLDAAISFYSMASELDNEKAGKYLGQIYEKRYQQSNLQSDKDLALHFYLKTAKLERTDLGFPPALKAYYNLKYPFITDFSNVSPYWQNENMLPKTKEDYDKSQAAWAAYKIKHKEFLKKMAQRPLIFVKSVFINRYSPDSTKSFVLTATKGYEKVLLKKMQFDELKYGDCYYNVVKKDFVPFNNANANDLSKSAIVFALPFEDYNINFNYRENAACSACYGEGFVKVSSGAYTYQVATGRYTETRSSTIVGQTVSVTRTPVYESRTINTGPPKYELCKVCDGTGGRTKEKIIQIVVDGVKIE